MRVDGATPLPVPARSRCLELHRACPFDHWAVDGQRIARIRSGSAWALGDWLLFGESNFGQFGTALPSTRRTSTIRPCATTLGGPNFADVTQHHDGLSFQHHAEVASLSTAEQDLWLHRAETKGWSRNRTARRLRVQHAAQRRLSARPPARFSVSKRRTNRSNAGARRPPKPSRSCSIRSDAWRMPQPSGR